jgi:hypothetical protein
MEIKPNPLGGTAEAAELEFWLPAGADVEARMTKAFVERPVWRRSLKNVE